MQLSTTLTRFLLAMLIFTLSWGAATAQNVVTFAGGSGNERFNSIFQLSDNTYLIGGQADDLNWLPTGTQVVTLTVNEPVVSNATSVAFILHVSADLQNIIRAVRFPAGTVRDVYKIKSTNLPGQPTGDIYISGSRDNTGSAATDGYYIARLNNNFINGVPTGLHFYRAINSRQRNGGSNNVHHPVGSESYGKQMQTWDVGANGFVVFSGGNDFSFDNMVLGAIGKSGRDTLVDYFSIHNRRGVPGTLSIVPASSFINNTNDPALDLVSSFKWLKYAGTAQVGAFRSYTQQLFDFISNDENGNTGRKGAYPFDIAFSGPQLLGGAPVSTAVPGYTGYSFNGSGGKWTGKVGDIVIDKRNNDFYVSVMISVASPSSITGLDDVEPAIVACRADGFIKWWARTHRETVNHSPAQQHIEGLAINYNTNELVVLGRTRGHAENNFWKGNELLAKPGGNGFQNDLTGNINNAAFPDYAWLGKYNMLNGRIMASTYVAELAPSATYSNASSNPNMDGWPDFNSYLELGVTRLREVAVNQSTGDIYVTGNSLRPFTTSLAFQKMLKPGAPGNNTGAAVSSADFASINHNNVPGAAFIRVYNSSLDTVKYSTLVTGVWNPLNGNNSNNLHLRGILPTNDGVLFTGWHTGSGNDFPAINVPSWGTATISGQTPVLGMLKIENLGGSPPPQPQPIVGPTNVCQSTTLVYSVPPVPGATSYRWYIEAFGWTGSSTTNSITLTRPANTPGGILYVVAVNQFGFSVPRAIILPGTNNPAAPTSASFPNVHCVGETKEYSVNTVTGAKTYNWQLTGPGCAAWSLSEDTTTINTTKLTLNNAITQPCSLAVTVSSCTATSPVATFPLPAGDIPVTTPVFIPFTTDICQGSTRTFSVQPVPGAIYYQWTVPSGFNGSSTTNSITLTHVNNVSGGPLSVVAVGACNTSSPATINLTPPIPGSVPTAPTVINGPEGFCGPDTITLSVTPTPGITYNWTVSGGGLNLINTTGASVEVFGAAGNGTGFVFVTATNACGTSLPTSKRVQRGNPGFLPDSRIFGIPSSLCIGESDTLYVTPNPRAISYTWTLPAGWNSSPGPTANSIVISPGPSAVKGTVTVTAVGECGTANLSGGTDSLYVGGSPISFTISSLGGNFEQCSNTTLTYWVQGANLNAATRFNWILPPGWFVTNASATAPAWDTVQITAGPNAQLGILTVRAIGSNVCGSDTALLKPGAGDPPGAISGPTTACGGALQYSVAPVIGADSLVWSVSPANAGTVVGNGTTVTINWNSAYSGTALITVRAARQCGLSPASPALAVTLGLSAPTAANITVCAPGPVTISPSGAVSYRYYTTATGGVPVATGVTFTLTVASDTIIYVSAFDPNSNCESAQRTAVNISFGGGPAAPNVNTVPQVCAGSGVTLSVANPIPNATYQWFTVGGASPIFTGASFTTGPLGADTAFQVAVTENGCTSARTTVNVVVTPSPAAPSLPSNTVSRCGPGNISVTPTTAGTFIVYDAPTGGNNLGQFTNTITVNVTASTTLYIAALAGSCESQQRTSLVVNINPVPATPVYQSGDTVICAGNSTTIVVADVPSATYTWYDAANNPIPGANNASFTTPVLNSNTTISVSVTVGGCESARRIFNIAISPAPAAPTIADQNVCVGQQVTLAPTGAPSFNFYSVATGGTPIGTGTTFTFQATVTDTFFVSSLVGANCESATRTRVIINVFPPPVAPVLSGASVICPGASTTITASSTTPGATFRWFDATGQTQLGTGATFTITQPGTYQAAAVLGTCVSTLTAITITQGAPAPDFNVTNVSTCAGGEVTITPTGGSDIFFFYSQPTGGSPVFVGPVYTFTPAATTTIYVASVSNDDCQSVERKAVLVTVNPVPAAPEVQNNVPICAGSSLTLNASTNLPDAEIRWFDGAGNQVATGSSYNTGVLNQNTTFTVQAVLGSCSSTVTTVNVVVTPAPEAPTITGSTSTCAGTSVTLSATSATPGVQIRWLNADGEEISVGENFTTPALTANTTYFAEAFIGTCVSTRTQVVVTVQEVVNPVIVGTSFNVCAGSTLAFSVENPLSGYTYRWTLGVDNQLIGEGNSINTPALTANTQINLQGIVGACSTDVVSNNITVTPLPVVSISPSRNITINQGESVEITASGGTSYNWIPAGSLSSSNTPTVRATPSVTTRYQVIVSDGGCSTTDTVLVTVIPRALLPIKIPAGFTPNGDGQNETWVIENITLYPNNKVTVLNRFGNVVFERNNYQNDWDGDNLPVATYYYIIDLGNGEKAKSGTVTIIK